MLSHGEEIESMLMTMHANQIDVVGETVGGLASCTHRSREGGGGARRNAGVVPYTGRCRTGGTTQGQKKEKTEKSRNEQQRGAHELDGLHGGLDGWVFRISRSRVLAQ